jgi:hypothetical protein
MSWIQIATSTNTAVIENKIFADIGKASWPENGARMDLSIVIAREQSFASSNIGAPTSRARGAAYIPSSHLGAQENGPRPTVSLPIQRAPAKDRGILQAIATE